MKNIMNERTKKGLEVLQSAVLLGVLGDVLLRVTPWGLNVFLFVSALIAAMAMLALRRKRELWNKSSVALNCALIFFSLMFVWRDSIELKTFDALAILTILAGLILPSLNVKTYAAGVFHYIIGFVWSGISIFFAPFFLLINDIKWTTIPQTGWSKHLISALRGLLIAFPLVLIFGALFVAADAVFENLVQNTFNIDGNILVGHILLTGFFSWITAGYLRSFLNENHSKDLAETFIKPKEDVERQTLSVTDIKDEDKENTVQTPLSVTNIKDEDAPADDKNESKKDGKKSWEWQTLDNSFLPKYFTIGSIEISVILGLINLLFLAFVIVQIPYLFGGMDLVQTTPDFKLADYARRGFGELVIVSALVLPILLISHWLLRKESPLNEKIYRALAFVQIGLLFVIMISAAQRLLLLTGNLGYGLTTVRFYPMAFMVLLALVFVWFGVTVLRGMRQRFAWGALWLALFTLGTLHVLNPDDFIVRTNFRLMQQGRGFDVHYNSSLSDDAIPALFEFLPQMDIYNKCAVKEKFLDRLHVKKESNDFRSWNWSRHIAKNQMTQFSKNWDMSECPNYTPLSDRFPGNY